MQLFIKVELAKKYVSASLNSLTVSKVFSTNANVHFFALPLRLRLKSGMPCQCMVRNGNEIVCVFIL